MDDELQDDAGDFPTGPNDKEWLERAKARFRAKKESADADRAAASVAGDVPPVTSADVRGIDARAAAGSFPTGPRTAAGDDDTQLEGDTQFERPPPPLEQPQDFWDRDIDPATFIDPPAPPKRRPNGDAGGGFRPPDPKSGASPGGGFRPPDPKSGASPGGGFFDDGPTGEVEVSRPKEGIAKPPSDQSRWETDVLRFLRDIRGAVLEMQKAAASPVPGAKSPDHAEAEHGQAEQKPGMKDAVRPITERLERTKLGQIGKRAWERVKPFMPKGKAPRTKAPSASKPSPGPKGSPPLPNGKGPPVPPGGKPPVPAGAGGAAAGGGRAAAGAAAGAEGAAAGGAMGAAAAVAIPVAVAFAMYELADATIEAAYSQEQFNRTLAEVSPSMAAVFAERDANKTIRKFESGENTADSAGTLSRALDKWEATIQPIEDQLSTLSNVGLAGLVDALTTMAELVRFMTPMLEKIAEKAGYKENNGQADLFGDFLDRTYVEQQGKHAAAQAKINAANRAHKRN